MKTIRNNIAVKTAAYILMLISILCLVGSFAVAGVNFFNQWYSKSSDNVTKDIYEKVAVQMYITLSDALYGENQTHIKNPDIQAELFEGEDDAKE